MKTKSNIYVLIFNNDDCDCQWSDTIMGSHDWQLLENYKKEIERKSAILREKIKQMDTKKWAALKPLADRSRELIQKKVWNKPGEQQKEYRELTNKMAKIHNEYSRKKNEFLSEMAMIEDHFIDDVELQSLEITVLPMLDGEDHEETQI